MMTDRDIDIHLYTDTLDVSEALKAMGPILASPKTVRLTYINGADTDEHCLEWHLQMKDDGGDIWMLDMIQILANSVLDGFFEDTTEAIIDALTPESRRTILELKAADPKTENICGIEFYKAVIADHIHTWDEFMAWRKANPLESIYSWRP